MADAEVRAGAEGEADADAGAEGRADPVEPAVGVPTPVSALPEVPPCGLAVSLMASVAGTCSPPVACVAPSSRWCPGPGSTPVATAAAPTATATETPSRVVRTGRAVLVRRGPSGVGPPSPDSGRSPADGCPGASPPAPEPCVCVSSVARPVAARPAAERRWRPMPLPSSWYFLVRAVDAVPVRRGIRRRVTPIDQPDPLDRVGFMRFDGSGPYLNSPWGDVSEETPAG
ncbi:hypothetical protein ACE1SV_46510 [Streptomyces sp. E-15]